MDINNMSIADWRKIFKFIYVNGPKPRESYIAITGYRGTASVVEIPEMIGKATVIEIYEKAFKDNKYVKTVTLPQTIIRISESAFEGCKNLENIALGDQVQDIRWDAFKNCTSLKAVTIPPLVTRLNGGTFEGCTNLEHVELPQNMRRALGDFAGCHQLADANGLVIINGYVCSYLGQEERVVIPEGTKKIISLRGSRDPRNQYLAFSGIKELIVPSSVECIEKDDYEPHKPRIIRM